MKKQSMETAVEDSVRYFKYGGQERPLFERGALELAGIWERARERPGRKPS